MLPIYVINLDRDTDRLAWMSNQFDTLGISWTRLPAVHVSDPDVLNRTNKLSCIHGQCRLTPGEIGCSLSHERIWQMVAEGLAPYACVFEDDVVLSQRILPFLDSACWAPSTLDLMRFETSYAPTYLGQFPVISQGGVDVRHSMKNFGGSAGYIISKNYAATMLARAPHNQEALDLFLFSPRHSTTVYQTMPGLCIQTTNLDKAGLGNNQIEQNIFASNLRDALNHRPGYAQDTLWRRFKGALRSRYRIIRHKAELTTIPFDFENSVSDTTK